MAALVTIENLSRATRLAGSADVAGGLLSRGRGLMGVTEWRGRDGLVLEHCNSIHTFFMRMPIDVVYLDRDGQVLRADEAMRPWRIGPLVWRAKRVLELPAGAVARSETRVGDRLRLSDLD